MQDHKKKAVVAGHICVDITPIFPGKKAARIEDALLPGKLIHMKGVDIHTGGCVANTGLAMKILGSEVCLMGKIGADDFGGLVRGILKKHQAESRMTVSRDAATSYTVVLAIPGIDRCFLHDPGANNTFGKDDLDEDVIRQAALFHFGYPPLLRRMYLGGGRELIAMLKRVKELGPAVSLDLAAVDPDSEAGKADWPAILEKALPYVDFFVPSAEELCYMLDGRRYGEWQRRADGGDMTEILTPADIRPLADRVLELGAKAALIKCGAPGIYYKTAAADRIGPLCRMLDLSVEQWAEKEGFEYSYEPEKVLSGTGAGDTSIAAFLSAALRGESLEDALHMAAGTGAACVAAYDALSGLLPYEELKEKIRKGWKKKTPRTALPRP